MRPIAEQRALPFALLVAFDFVAVVASLVVATAVRHSSLLDPLWIALDQSILVGAAWTPTQSVLLVFQGVAIPFGLAALNQYRTLAGGRPWWSVERVVAVVTIATLAAMAAIYVTRLAYIPRGVMLLDYALLLGGTVGWRMFWERKVNTRIERGIGRRNVIIVGSGPQAQQIAREIVLKPEHGRRVVGFLANTLVEPFTDIPEEVLARDDVWAPWHQKSASYPSWMHQFARDAQDGEEDNLSSRISPVAVENTRRQHAHFLMTVGDTSPHDVSRAIDGLCAAEVLIAPDLSHDETATIVRTCRTRGVDAHLIPHHYTELAVEHEPWKLGEFTVIGLYKRPISQLGWAMKRSLDIMGGLFGLLIFSPILLASIIAIKIGDPKGPVFYRGTRIGYKGQHFKILKLSTMVSNADDLRDQLKAKNARQGPWYQIEAKDDFRITKVGHFLRKYTINELPQFWNCVRGDMSLVGPRPLAKDEVAQFVEYDFRYYRAFDVKPGMTGLWQVMLREDPSFDARIQMDFDYIHNWSIWLDLKILFLTPIMVFAKKGR